MLLQMGAGIDCFCGLEGGTFGFLDFYIEHCLKAVISSRLAILRGVFFGLKINT